MKEFLVTLKNSEQALIRKIKFSDKEFLAKGIKELSAESIQHRFFLAKKGFSDKELANLTEFDPRQHFAIGAISHPSLDHGLAIARFNIDHDNPKTAEFALLVIDAYHGQGLGKILLKELIKEAKSKGLTSLWGQMKSTNMKMMKLAQSIEDVTVKTSPEGQGIINIEILF
ncbi:MAG: hypothetical protein BM556_15975 [Bacteriovorax sp. MedPE-SWde]|mgnify:CR=1 FL=1|nr:MAG: hypothetical protein BM556_15975 [Bacteriovorax sp. MedPE-SWde]